MSNDTFATEPVTYRPSQARNNPPQPKREAAEKADPDAKPVVARLAQGGPGAPLTVKQDDARPITFTRKQPTGIDPRAAVALPDFKQ